MKRKDKVVIVKLDSHGHTSIVASRANAYNIIGQYLDDGMFVFCEPDNIVISERSELYNRDLESVIVFAPVAGG
ncbi:MAG: hypothetical protein ACTSYB_19310 [Candidatus Helarchaeota archaeon]